MDVRIPILKIQFCLVLIPWFDFNFPNFSSRLSLIRIRYWVGPHRHGIPEWIGHHVQLGVKDDIVVELLGDGLDETGVFVIDGVRGQVVDDLEKVLNGVVSQLVDVERPRCGASSGADAKT